MRGSAFTGAQWDVQTDQLRARASPCQYSSHMSPPARLGKALLGLSSAMIRTNGHVSCFDSVLYSCTVLRVI